MNRPFGAENLITTGPARSGASGQTRTPTAASTGQGYGLDDLRLLPAVLATGRSAHARAQHRRAARTAGRCVAFDGTSTGSPHEPPNSRDHSAHRPDRGRDDVSRCRRRLRSRDRSHWRPPGWRTSARSPARASRLRCRRIPPKAPNIEIIKASTSVTTMRRQRFIPSAIVMPNSRVRSEVIIMTVPKMPNPMTT